MELLVAYDISTTTPQGARRLRQVAKACEGFGHRVQNSVFELTIPDHEYPLVRYQITRLIDPTTDSLRFYRLPASTFQHTEHHGRTITPEHRQDHVL